MMVPPFFLIWWDFDEENHPIGRSTGNTESGNTVTRIGIWETFVYHIILMILMNLFNQSDIVLMMGSLDKKQNFTVLFLSVIQLNMSND